MNRNTQQVERTERAKLNRIADERSATGELPDDTSAADVKVICEELHEEIETLIESHVTETNLTPDEAEVWLLSNLCDTNHVFLTDEAIALAFSVPDTPFGEPTDAPLTRGVNSSPSVADVEHLYERAERKYEKAREFVGLTTFRDREEFLATPAISWLDRSTRSRLKGRLQPDDATLDDVVSRLLLETETRLSLEAFTRRYLAARGKDAIAQVAVNQPAPESGTLSLTAHTGIREELPAVVQETDAIVIDGHQYDFHFTEDPHGPHEGHDRISLYAADNILGMEAVQIDDGIEAARDRFQDAAAEADGGQR